MTDVATVLGWGVIVLGNTLGALAVLALCAWLAVWLVDRISHDLKVAYIAAQFIVEWVRLDKPTRRRAMARAIRVTRNRDRRLRNKCTECGFTLDGCSFCEMEHDSTVETAEVEPT